VEQPGRDLPQLFEADPEITRITVELLTGVQVTGQGVRVLSTGVVPLQAEAMERLTEADLRQIVEVMEL
jgi:hypothetical protein